MAGQAVQFGQNNANILRARRRLHAEQLFHGFAVSQSVRDRGNIIHPVDVGIEHRVGPVLGDFFHAAVEIADDAFEAQTFFAVEPRITRSTPWVAGCCGPILMTSSLEVEKCLLGLVQVEVRE